MEKFLFAVGAGTYLGGKAAHLVTGLDTRRIQNRGKSMMVGAAVIAGLQVLGELGSIIMGHEGIHTYDVRNDTPERRAAMRRELETLSQSVEAPAVPIDEADKVALQERFITAMQDVTCPQDPCGWYRFGWRMHNALLERVLENEGLATALALAMTDEDGPQFMRLARIPQEEIKCNRFWFGFRDANNAMASRMASFAVKGTHGA